MTDTRPTTRILLATSDEKTLKDWVGSLLDEGFSTQNNAVLTTIIHEAQSGIVVIRSGIEEIHVTTSHAAAEQALRPRNAFAACFFGERLAYPLMQTQVSTGDLIARVLNRRDSTTDVTMLTSGGEGALHALNRVNTINDFSQLIQKGHLVTHPPAFFANTAQLAQYLTLPPQETAGTGGCGTPRAQAALTL